MDGSPAEDTGLEAGNEDISFQGQDGIAVGSNIIVAVDGKRLTREHDLADEIAAHSAGEQVALSIFREGDRRAPRGRSRPPSRRIAAVALSLFGRFCACSG